jgi:hypothetical protein
MTDSTEAMSGRRMAAVIANLPDDVVADLVTTNELGEGDRDYRLVGDVLYVDLYMTDRFDKSGLPVPDVTYRVDIHLTLEDSAADRGE